MSEYIGSRISLISKSDIKYIGTLHEISSESHTVALESVTSYGTEGRKGNPAEEISGSDQVYEYIVFRGSDVKELKIVSPPGEKEKQPSPPKVPNDPAILGSARPPPPPSQQQEQQQPPYQNQFRGGPPPYPQQHPQFGYPGPPPNQLQGQPRFQGPGGPHGFPGSPGAVPGYGFPPPPPPGYGMGFNGPPPPGHGFPHQFPPGQGPPPHQQYPGPPGPPMNQQQRPPQQMQMQNPNQHQQQQPPVGSKQGTPQPQQHQAPPPQAPVEPDPKPVEMSATPGPTSESPAGPPPPVESKPSVAAATAPSTAPQQPKQSQQPKAAQRAPNNRVAVPLPQQQRPHQPTQPTPAQPQSFADATQAATAAVAAAMAKLGSAKPQQQTDGATDVLAQRVGQMRVQDQQQRGGRAPRARGAGAPRGGGRSRDIEVPKEDYDFETANAKFNKQELVKEAIATGSPNPLGSPNGNGAGDPFAAAAATNGHAGEAEKDAAADSDFVIPPADKSYDKKSSFFDNISSDLKDRVEQAQNAEDGRSGGFDGRAMRAQERTKNFDTFGQSNVDGGNYRGGYRGRGRGYGYRGDRGRGDRGGFRGRGGFESRGGGGFGGRGSSGNGDAGGAIAS